VKDSPLIVFDVPCDFTLEILELFTRQRADLAQGSEVFLRALQVVFDKPPQCIHVHRDAEDLA
jgi:hypothetical protein